MDPYIAGLSMAPVSEGAARRARDRWNAVAKPIGSLGLLEDAVVRIAGLAGTERVSISRRCAVVFCADNGVVDRGVTQCGPEVSAIVAGSIARGTSSICRMGAVAGLDWLAVDVGLLEHPNVEGLLNRCVRAGTDDITRGPAMTRQQAVQAMRVGVDLVGELAGQGNRLLVAGEMGIGNTTTAAAMACAFTGMGPADLVGRGAGLGESGLVRKREAVAEALRVNRPDPRDPIDVISKVGGLDIAGMCGMFLGGAVHRVPVILDGLVSVVAAFCACQLRPECRHAMIASHVSAEPAAAVMLDRLGLRPVIDAGMRLGEGTGAACMVPLLDMALALYDGTTFADYGMRAYEERPQ